MDGFVPETEADATPEVLSLHGRRAKSKRAGGEKFLAPRLQTPKISPGSAWNRQHWENAPCVFWF